MENTEKTHWRKNNDSKFISGEDLKASLNGLKPEMVVSIERFLDQETFDQNKNEKRVVTGLFLKEQSGKLLYKPVILNKTNAKFFVKETGSDFIDDWVGVPVTLHCVADNRHGYVVRFKKFAKLILKIGDKNFINCRKAYVSDANNLSAIKKKYNISPEVEAALIAQEGKANG